MKVRKIKAMRDRQLRRHLAGWWESTVTVRHYLHLLAAVRARQKARALGVPASEYLAKIKADPRRAAALQRARDRTAGVLADAPAEQWPRDLSEAEMDELATALNEHDAGSIGFHGLVDRVLAVVRRTAGVLPSDGGQQ